MYVYLYRSINIQLSLPIQSFFPNLFNFISSGSLVMKDDLADWNNDFNTLLVLVLIHILIFLK